jgi:hypothetical protein
MGRAEDLSRVSSYLAEATRLLLDNPEAAVDISVHGLLAYAHLRLGEREEARQVAEKALQKVTSASTTVFSTLDGLCHIPEVFLRLWETAGEDQRRTLQQSARASCKALHAYARVFPIGRPRAWLWQGVYEWLSGRKDSARRSWQKSMTCAEKLKMPHDHGLAYYEIGRHLPPGDPARRGYLARAQAIFYWVGAEHDLAQVQAELERQR